MKLILFLTWSEKCFIVSIGVANQDGTFARTDTKICVPVVTLSTLNNVKLLDQLKSGFKRTLNWNKYQSKATIQTQNQYLDYLIDPSFLEVNRPFDMSFESYLPIVEMKDNNVKIEWKNLFDKPLKTDTKTYDNIQKIATCQGDDYTTSCFLNYAYAKNYYKTIAE